MNLCLGTVQFGLDYGIQGNGKPQFEDVSNILTYSIEHGISHFDTASAYGEAEDVLGHYIKTNPDKAKEMQIISKLRPDAFNEITKNEWAKAALDGARSSLERIGIDHFSAYLFHNASYIFDEDAIKSLYSVKQNGLADRIGVSIYTPEEAMKALEYKEIGAIQIPYNVFDRRLDKCGFFDKAMDNGVTVYARSSLLQGLAVMDPGNLPDRVSFAKDYLVGYDKLCKEFNIPRLNASIAYVSRKRGIDFVVFGVDNLTQLEEYISIEDNAIPDELINRIDDLFMDVPEKLVNPVLWK